MSGAVGVFIVVEGPNGVGKTTICKAVTEWLVALRIETHATAEPTRTSLGVAIRELEATMPPHALALACAADRCDHVAREIEPCLRDGIWVVCDRYVPSSLVLQRLDGLKVEWIWSLNSLCRQPDLTVYLENDPDIINARLDWRGRHSRFETRGSPARELDYYREAREFLSRHGWKQAVIDCGSRAPVEIAAEIASRHLGAASP